MRLSSNSTSITNKRLFYSPPKNILKDIEITPVSNVDEVLKIALTKELKPVEWIEVENLPKSKTGEICRNLRQPMKLSLQS